MFYNQIAPSTDTQIYIENEIIPQILHVLETSNLTYFDAAFVPSFLQDAIKECTDRKAQTSRFSVQTSEKREISRDLHIRESISAGVK